MLRDFLLVGERQRGAQITARLQQQSVSLLLAAALQKQHCDLDALIRLLQRIAHFLAGTTADLPQDGFAARHKLGVDRLHVHHQAPMHAAEPDHGQGRKQVKRDALGGTRFHPGGSGDRFGAGIEKDRVVGFLQERRRRVVGNPDRQRATFFGTAQARKRERRRAAGGDGDERIEGANVVLLHELARVSGLILSAFGGTEQRLLAAGHQQQELLLRPIESGNQFRAVLNRQPPRRAGAGIDQPAALPQPHLDGCRRPVDAAEHRPDRGDGGHLTLDQGVENVARFPEVDVRIAWTGAFGLHWHQVVAKNHIATTLFLQRNEEIVLEQCKVDKHLLLLGVDGGGTRCRARLSSSCGTVLAEAVSGPANIRLGLARSFAAVIDAAAQCLRDAALSESDMSRMVACLAMAGASEPDHAAAAQRRAHPFQRMIMTTDAHAACLGAHGGRDGGIIIAGTGTIGWAIVQGRIHRVGGWGLPISDEGSGAWLGSELLRRVLWARDGRVPWTPLLRGVFAEFRETPHAILDWVARARSADLGAFAPRIVAHAAERDAAAVELMSLAAGHIDALAKRLVDGVGAERLSLMGGLAASLRPWLCPAAQSRLVEPAGDALTGALALARGIARELTRAA